MRLTGLLLAACLPAFLAGLLACWLARASRCMPRLRIALKDSFPRHMAAHKGGGGGGGGGGGASMLLPREAASQLAISQLLAKLALCLPACRAPLLR